MFSLLRCPVLTLHLFVFIFSCSNLYILNVCGLCFNISSVSVFDCIVWCLIVVICPIAIACSMGQIIKLVCVCQCISVCPSASTLMVDISWSNFTKIGTDARTPQRKNNFIRGQYHTTPSSILPLPQRKTFILGREVLKTHANINWSYICLKCMQIATICASFRKSGSRNMTVTSDFRLEVEIRPFHPCAMHPGIIIGTVRPLWTWLWGRYHVPQNVFLVNLIIPSVICISRLLNINSIGQQVVFMVELSAAEYSCAESEPSSISILCLPSFYYIHSLNVVFVLFYLLLPLCFRILVACQHFIQRGLKLSCSNICKNLHVLSALFILQNWYCSR